MHAWQFAAWARRGAPAKYLMTSGADTRGAGWWGPLENVTCARMEYAALG